MMRWRWLMEEPGTGSRSGVADRSRASRVRQAGSGARGMTLIELTMAMGMLVTLSMVLFGFLRTGMGLYKQGEGRRDVYERAQILLDLLVRDLDQVAAAPRRPGVAPRITLLGDRDDAGRSRLRFVRSLGTETVDPVLRQAGTGPRPEAVVDLVDDVQEAYRGKLRAPEGLMEVAYVARREEVRASQRKKSGSGEAPGVWLYRGVRSPIGGGGSLFDNQQMPARNQEPGAAFRPLTSGVLQLGFRYRGIDKTGKPEWFDTWDSTRGRLTAFGLFVDPSSLGDSSDDVMPSAIEATLVLEEPGAGRVFLTRAIQATSRSLSVNTTNLLKLDGDEGWVRIDDEWIRVSIQGATTLKVEDRGGRGTEATGHDARARVRFGSSFQRVIPVPVGWREAWN